MGVVQVVQIFQRSQQTDVALETEQKFRFYVLSLIFTLLALSVQTGKFGRSILEDLLEIGGWLALLTAGLTALSKVEWEVVIRLQHARRDEFEQSKSQLQQAANAGLQTIHVAEDETDKPIPERIAEYDAALEELEPIVEELESTDSRKYQVAKYSFIAGLVLVIGSRSVGAITALIGIRLL